MAQLDGKVALVTGGAHRIGRAIVLQLAAAGAAISLHYGTSEDAAHQTAADVREQYGRDVLLVQADLRDPANAAPVIDTTIAHYGQLDVLVLSAGVWGKTPTGATTPDDWDTMMHINARMPYLLAQHAAPHLTARKGCVVAITDVGITGAWKHYAAYLASKAALDQSMRVLARDLAPAVRVNTVAPGSVLAPDDWDEEQQQATAKKNLLARWGTAEDVAGAVLYLATAPFVNGVMLPIDGGERLK